jgi:hypothetical protein
MRSRAMGLAGAATMTMALAVGAAGPAGAAVLEVCPLGCSYSDVGVAFGGRGLRR